MEDVEGASFSSFLAGALLSFDKISNLELASYITSFEVIYNVNIYDDNMRELYDLVYYDGTFFGLNKYLDDRYKGFGTVKDYLYKMTNSEIRKFFNIQDIVINNIINSNIKNTGIFNKIKTRVFR